MGTPEKIYNKWTLNRPKEAKIREVKTVLNAYFPDQWGCKGGSHIVVRNEILKKVPDFQPYGEFTIPVKHGKRVKGFYLKTILKAIEILKEFEEQE